MSALPLEADSLHLVTGSGLIEAWKVGAEVGNVRNNRPELMKPANLL
jgi:hypothetical protein